MSSSSSTALARLMKKNSLVSSSQAVIVAKMPSAQAQVYVDNVMQHVKNLEPIRVTPNPWIFLKQAIDNSISLLTNENQSRLNELNKAYTKIDRELKVRLVDAACDATKFLTRVIVIIKRGSVTEEDAVALETLANTCAPDLISALKTFVEQSQEKLGIVFNSLASKTFNIDAVLDKVTMCERKEKIAFDEWSTAVNKLSTRKGSIAGLVVQQNTLKTAITDVVSAKAALQRRIDELRQLAINHQRDLLAHRDSYNSSSSRSSILFFTISSNSSNQHIDRGERIVLANQRETRAELQAAEALLPTLDATASSTKLAMIATQLATESAALTADENEVTKAKEAHTTANSELDNAKIELNNIYVMAGTHADASIRAVANLRTALTSAITDLGLTGVQLQFQLNRTEYDAIDQFRQSALAALRILQLADFFVANLNAIGDTCLILEATASTPVLSLE